MSALAEYQHLSRKPYSTPYPYDGFVDNLSWYPINATIPDNEYLQHNNVMYAVNDPMLQMPLQNYWQPNGWPHGCNSHHPPAMTKVVTEGKAPFKETNYRQKYTTTDRDKSKPKKGDTKKVVIHDNRVRNKKIMELGKLRKWKVILRIVEKEKDQFDNVNWSTTFSQISKIRSLNRHDTRFLSLINAYANCLEDKGLEYAGVRELANVVHAIGKMQLHNPAVTRIMKFVARNTKTIVQEGKTQEVANICWSFAKLKECLYDDVAAQTFLAEVDLHSDWLVNHGKTQEVANVVWACATLNIKSRRLFAKTEDRASWLVKNSSPQGVSNTAWAFATMGLQAPNLFAEIEKCAAWLVTSGKPQEVVITAWSFATLDIPSPKFFLEIEKRADWLIQNGNAQDISIITWAFCHFKYRSPSLVEEAIKVRGEWLVAHGTTKDIAAAAMAYSNCGYDAISFFQALSDEISYLIENGSPQEIINVCYAMSILRLGKKHASAFHRLWTLAIDLDPEVLANSELVQLGQVYVYSTADEIEMEQIPPRLLFKIQNALPGEANNQNMTCKQVSRFLKLLGLDCKEEGSPLEGSKFDNGMLCIDLICRSHVLAIEYDGYYHYLKELGTGMVTRIEDGTTRAKRRFLQQMGWKVINIDYRDWCEIREDNNKLLFLRDKLSQVGIHVQVPVDTKI